VDVHDKLDELSALVENARAMPISASCVVNRGQVLDLLDEVRALLPTSLAQADDVLAEREGIVAAARVSAAQILSQADEEARARVSEHEVYRAAVAEADAVRAEADAEAERMRRETDDYVDAKLANFEVALHKTLTAVQKGRDKIRGRQAYDDLGDDLAPLPGEYRE
jgi:cell division septum initiation protein DivIVA